ncbi:MAG: DUF3944 domain-containing protein [Aestuariivita sp.]|nr:DUF3944 domain-containing protein [Aestuariivita sp.]
MPLPPILAGLGYFVAGTMATAAAVGVASQFRDYKYRKDPDLDFLGDVSSGELAPLYDICTAKWSSDLPTLEVVKQHHPDHKRYWKEIACELQTYGGNTISNVYRGKGVLYREILSDVCKQYKIKFNSDLATEALEKAFLEQTLSDALKNMRESDRIELLKYLSVDDEVVVNLARQLPVEVGRQILRSGGFVTYKWAMIIAKHTFHRISKLVFGKGLPLAFNATVNKSIGVLLGPVGAALSVAWTTYDLFAPATRSVGIPVVTYVAMLRLQQGAEDWKLQLPPAS